MEGWAICQCLGDAVFIPAGAPHQVRIHRSSLMRPHIASSYFKADIYLSSRHKTFHKRVGTKESKSLCLTNFLLSTSSFHEISCYLMCITWSRVSRSFRQYEFVVRRQYFSQTPSYSIRLTYRICSVRFEISTAVLRLLRTLFHQR